jgi:hypothetical protein
VIWLLADLPRPHRDPGHVKDVVHRIVTDRPYTRAGPSTVERVRHDVVDYLARLLAAVAGSGVGAWIILAVVAAVVGLLAWRFARGTSADRGLATVSPGDRVRPAADWRAEAEAHERAGEWREALRCRYRALVADLAGRGLVEEIPGRTAGEYRVEVAGAVPAAGPPFAGATELFERAWYGRRPTDAGDAGRFRDLEARVLEAAR